MSATISRSTVERTFKKTIDNLCLDKTDGLEANMVMPDYLDVETMSDGWVEDKEYATDGLMPEKPEGEELEIGALTPGSTKRYVARTFGKRMIITEEAREDCKYPEIIDLAKFLKRSAYKTVEYDAAMIPARGWNTAFTGWDGLCLFNASHLNPNGDTYSNTMATPLPPSVAAVSSARASCTRMPGRDGLIDGIRLKKVCFTPAQETDWEELVGSKMRPENGNFAAINVVQKMSLEMVMIPFWTNTDTNYFFKTDADNGLKWKWRRKMRSRTWMTNEQEVESFSITFRADSGWTDPRGAFGVQYGG